MTDVGPAYDIVQNAEAVVRVFGQFNLFDAEVRSVRLTDARGGSSLAESALEIELELPGEFAIGVSGSERSRAYRIRLRCTNIDELALLDFGYQNVVEDYSFTAAQDRAASRQSIHVSIAGVGCDLSVYCRSVEVLEVIPVPA